MGVIIGIHGLANKPPENTLHQGWRNALSEGLKRNRGIEAGLNFTGVYWADVMYDSPKEPDPEPYRRRTPGTGALKRYRDSWVDDVVAGAMGAGGGVLDKAKRLFGFGLTADKVLDKKLSDLSRYYRKASEREALRGRLRDALLEVEGQRVMLIAHSMGSIIAYDTLRALGSEKPAYRLRHFVTIGSPLGLPHVLHKMRKEFGRVRTPSVVDQWSNFADRRDPVAFDVHLSGDYEASDRGVKVRDDLVLNDYGGIHHKSYGYLRAPEVTDAVAGFL